MNGLLKLTLFTATFAIACTKPALAEPPKAPAPAQKPKASAAPPAAAPTEANVPMPEWRARMLRDEVGLDEKTAAAVERILAKYRPERRVASETVDSERRKLNAMLELDSNDQAAYAKSIRALLDARQKLQDLQRKQAEELAKVLTPKQQAKLARAIGETRENLRHQGRGHGRRGKG
ncbi:MAG TPA: periplasmic heavy metal sensor [Polyangiaceae bacterium]